MSAFNKPQAVVRNIGNRTLNGAGEIRIPLNKDHLTSEHQVVVSMSQGFATAPTAMGDLSRMVRTVVLESDKGPLVNSDGMSLIALSAFTEKQPTQRKSVGTTSTGTLVFDLHHENDGALHDLLTALETSDFSGLDLVMYLDDPSSVGVYTGGATPAAPTFNVRVNARTYPALTNIGKSDGFQLPDGSIEANEFAGVGSLVHRVGTQVLRGTTTGDQQPVRLQAKSALVRFLQLLSLDNTGANPVASDSIIEDVRLVVNGNQVFNATFHEIQAVNESRRQLSSVVGSGIAVVDFGDDEVGFLDLPENNEAMVYFRIAPNAPANWEIRLVEDYSTEA